MKPYYLMNILEKLIILCIIGKEYFEKEDNLVYTVDTFYSLKNNESSINLVLNKKDADNIFDYVEVIRSGILLFSYLENFEENDTTLKIK